MKYFIQFDAITKNIKEQRSFQDKKGHQWPYLTIEEYKELPEKERRIAGDLRRQDSGSAELTLEDREALTGFMNIARGSGGTKRPLVIFRLYRKERGMSRSVV